MLATQKHFGGQATGLKTPPNHVSVVRFQVPTAASMKMTVFWDVAPCNLVEVDRRFRGAMIALMIEIVSILQFIIQWRYS
jgi:hypothetical protein